MNIVEGTQYTVQGPSLLGSINLGSMAASAGIAGMTEMTCLIKEVNTLNPQIPSSRASAFRNLTLGLGRKLFDGLL